jgi:hypothetical protein
MKVSELMEEVEAELLDIKARKARCVLVKKLEELARAKEVVKCLKKNLEKFKEMEVEDIRVNDYEY